MKQAKTRAAYWVRHSNVNDRSAWSLSLGKKTVGSVRLLTDGRYRWWGNDGILRHGHGHTASLREGCRMIGETLGLALRLLHPSVRYTRSRVRAAWALPAKRVQARAPAKPKKTTEHSHPNDIGQAFRETA